MRGLLRTYPPGVPTDTLLARIRGRRSFLLGEWDRLLLAPEPLEGLPPAPWRQEFGGEGGTVWRALQLEYAWTFRWMAEPLRIITAPFFWLEELRTLSICLRDLAGGHGVDEGLLGGSLSSDRIRNTLLRAPNADEALRRLSAILAPHAPPCATLAETEHKGGWGAVEGALVDIFLERLAASRLHPVMGRHVALMVDGRNLVALAKGLRWRMAGRPRLLSGGSIPLKKLVELFDRRDGDGIATLAARLGGIGRSGDPGEVERTVMQAEYLAVRGMAREPSGIGAIIDYLWRCRNEARSIGLLSRLATAGAAAVDGEIVR